VLTRAKAAKLLIDYETLIEESDYNDYEEKLINELDKKQTREAIDWLAEQLDKDETVLENQLINETKGEKK
jgi:hypothetical protein